MNILNNLFFQIDYSASYFYNRIERIHVSWYWKCLEAEIEHLNI